MGDAPLIRLEGVSKRYVQGELTTEVLKGLDLTINRGDFVALQGPSGSGKSTLLHILGLLDRPTTGRYLLSGQDVSSMDDDAQSGVRNTQFGFVFQSFYLIPYASALENVLLPGLYGTKSRRELTLRAQEILDQVGLTDRAGYRPSQLSGGQQQRVALARALLNRPAVIFADEPTGQLDSTTSGEIMSLLAQINAGGTTVIMVTHDEETASYAASSIQMLDGAIAQSD
ncbi:MAG: ABC transporter ATP-binding protein [Proteobacteria bacterium]|nr:ABC transporter ATP-binding protein [Pseudomonadota bacterium]